MTLPRARPHSTPYASTPRCAPPPATGKGLRLAFVFAIHRDMATGYCTANGLPVDFDELRESIKTKPAMGLFRGQEIRK